MVQTDPRTLSRRALLAGGAASLTIASLRSATTLAAQPDAARVAAHKRELLRKLLYAREDLDAWLAGKAFPFSKYDAELGYLHVDRDFKEGLDGALCRYRYDPSGARHMSRHADRPCRINTYGDSFTSCEQVGDGETWQEVLAAHLGEPVRNYGIGGYSVYQAYLRMRREEQRSPARYIIFNIFDDDHYRNLHGWQRTRFGTNRKSTNPPVPHVKVDPDAGRFVECRNPCPTSQSLYRLCELDSALEVMRDEYSLDKLARRAALREAGADNVPASDFDDPEDTRRALYATLRIVELVEQFAKQEDRRVLYVLSFGGDRVRRFVDGGKRFDQPLVDFLDMRRLPYVDLLRAHVDDFGKSDGDLKSYLARHFIGHYTPLGNLFCAFAMKNHVVKMLDPPPPAYSTAN
jgi:hypothetical protein